jgi:hypothetical protein
VVLGSVGYVLGFVDVTFKFTHSKGSVVEGESLERGCRNYCVGALGIVWYREGSAS